jgi:hypothetical protein
MRRLMLSLKYKALNKNHCQTPYIAEKNEHDTYTRIELKVIEILILKL